MPRSPFASVVLARRLLAGALVGLVLAAAGCGPGGGPDGEGSTDARREPEPVALRPVTVGVIPIVDVAPLFLGIDKGFFRDRGLDVKTVQAQGGPFIVKGVVGGEYNFGFANTTSLMINHTKKVPVRVVSSGVASTGRRGLDFGAVVVPARSAVRSAADLTGRRIAVNSVGTIGDTTVRESVRQAGGDPRRLTFVQMPLPEMQAAMDAGRVDAAWVSEPWLALTKGAGGRPVAWNYVDLAKGLTVAAYFTSEDFASAQPDLVRRFVDGMKESMRFADAHPDQVRQALQTHLKMERVLTEAMTLPLWPAEINRRSVERLAELGKRDGLFGEAEPDLDKLLPAA
jgi:NitT/TauT family transport system substrate-binding protein